jgi:hypothetical protein
VAALPDLNSSPTAAGDEAEKHQSSEPDVWAGGRRGTSAETEVFRIATRHQAVCIGLRAPGALSVRAHLVRGTLVVDGTAVDAKAQRAGLTGRTTGELAGLSLESSDTDVLIADFRIADTYLDR